MILEELKELNKNTMLFTESEYAKMFAATAHKNQQRKYTGEPYFVHLAGVVTELRNFVPSLTETMISAAYLHDTIEDTEVTEVTEELLRRCFSKEIVDLVVELTQRSKPEDGNRAVRKEIDRRFLSNVSYTAKIIKCADIIDNTRSIYTYDPKFAKVYIPECLALLEAISIDHVIWTHACKVVSFVERELGKRHNGS